MKNETAEQSGDGGNGLMKIDLSIVCDAFNSSVRGIIITDAEGVVRYVNRSFLNIFQMASEKNIVGANISGFFPLKDGSNFPVEGTIISNTRGSFEEFTCTVEEGHDITVEVYSSLVTNGDGDIIGKMASFVDISERKKIEQVISVQHGLSIIMNSINTISDALYQFLVKAISLDVFFCGVVYRLDREKGLTIETMAHSRKQLYMLNNDQVLEPPALNHLEPSRINVLYEDNADFNIFKRLLFFEENISSALYFPLYLEDDLTYFVIIGSRNPSRLPDFITEGFDVMASIVQAALNRIIVFDRLITMNIARLTVKEKEMLKLLSRGLGRKETAKKMDISLSTYDNHFSNMRKKLNMKDRNEVIRFAIEFREYYT